MVKYGVLEETRKVYEIENPTEEVRWAYVKETTTEGRYHVYIHDTYGEVFIYAVYENDPKQALEAGLRRFAERDTKFEPH